MLRMTIGAVAVVSMLSLPACSSTMWGMRGQSWRMQNTGQVPSAQGTVKVASATNDNTVVRVQMKHTPSPEKIAPGTSVYVVWARPAEGEKPIPLGALRPGDNQKAALETLTPLKSFDIIITPEKSPYVESPTTQPVLSTRVER